RALPRVAARARLVWQLVGVARGAAQLRLDVLDRAGVGQVAELFLPEQLAQQVTVERQSLCTPLRGRRVVFVHVRRDVVEQERGRIGRGGCGLDVDEVDRARPQSGQQPFERGQVEHVLQAL